MTTLEHLSLDSLAETYQILAEVRAHDDARAFLGTRRSDGSSVLITLARSPGPDTRNALTHFAADTNLLSALEHRCLVPVLAGRWLQSDVLAVVTERPTVPSLEELLARGDVPSSARIAAILQEVTGLLGWAREHGVVHRTVTPATLYLDPENDRVRASFVVRPLAITGAPGLEGDARTIGALAWTMFTRNPNGPDDARASLGDVRPDLPERLIAETEKLLAAKASDEPSPDLRDYVALVAMVDALRSGEDEAARVRTMLLQEERETHEQLEAERWEVERLRGEYEKRAAAEREEFQRTLTREREEVANERSKLARRIWEQRKDQHRERMQLEQELAEVRSLLMKEHGQLEELRGEIDRRLEIIAAERAAIAAQRLALAAESRAASTAGTVSRPAAEARPPVEPEYRDVSTSRLVRTRVVFATTLALTALVAATAFAVARHRSAVARRPGASAARGALVRGLARHVPPAIVIDSTAGNVDRSAVARPAPLGPASVVDSAPPVDTAVTSPALPGPTARARRVLRRVDTPASHPGSRRVPSDSSIGMMPAIAPPGSVFGRDRASRFRLPPIRPPSVLPPTRRDSVVRATRAPPDTLSVSPR